MNISEIKRRAMEFPDPLRGMIEQTPDELTSEELVSTAMAMIRIARVLDCKEER